MTRQRSHTKRTQSKTKVGQSRPRPIPVKPGQRIPTVQRAVGLGPPVINFGTPAAALSLQQLLGNQAVLGLLDLDQPVLDEAALEEEQGAGEDPKEEFTQEKIDQIVSDMIADQLEKYNNIPVIVKEKVPIAGAEGSQPSSAEQETAETSGESSPPEEAGASQPASKTVTKKVKVRAVYFINRHKDQVKAARKAAGFGQIADTIDVQLSELMGGSTKKGYHLLGAGRAVEVGKATPEDIELFLDQAVKSGEILNYGLREGVLKEGGQLVDLSNEALSKLIQDWMYATGVGVDCSGFINIALVRAREEIRDQMRAAGVPDEELPRSLARMQRPQLNKKKEVTDPTELRPGDVWVTHNGGHVRVIMTAQEKVDESGKSIMEFVTAESTTTGETGPAEKKWHTDSLKTIGPITNISGGGSTDGNIYKVRRAI
jgi:hypothetical protein